MSFFARASWPGDHRDEIVAGALAAAVIIVLGYASGIGAPASRTVDAAAPPTSQTPAEPSAPSSPGSGEHSVQPGNAGAGASDGSWALPADNVPPGYGGTGAGGHSEHQGGHGRHGGPGNSPVPGDSPEFPSPNPSHTPGDSCQDGQVHIVQPLLNGVLDPAAVLLDIPVGALSGDSDSWLSGDPANGVLDGSGRGLLTGSGDKTGEAADDPALCLGVAPSPSLAPRTAELKP